MLHGHMHSLPEYNYKDREAEIRRYDVGVDANNYFSVSLQQLKDFFAII